MEFATGYPHEGLCWVYFQLVSPHDVEHSFQVCEVTAFVTTFHGDIIYMAFYGLA